MLGVEFHDQSSSPSNVLMMLSRQKYLGYVAAAYLLNVHNIRIAPTLSDPFTLRLEPSAYISNAAIDRCVDALYAFCRLLEARDTAPLIRQQLGKPQRPVRDYRGARCSTREKPRTNARVAFIGNLILPEHAALLDPALADFSPEEMESYLSQTAHLLGPCIYDQINVRSQTGDEVHLSFVGLSLTARQIMESVRRGESKWVLEKIRQAVGLAVEEGCTVVGLGGHTSIASSNGLRLRGCKIALTSGNSLTVAMVVKCVERASRKMRIPLAQSSLAVVGASGNIGSTCALMLGPEFAAVYLVARCANSPALVALGEKIRDLAPNTEVQLTDSLDVLRRCSVVVSASNSPSTLIFPEHVAPAPVVICDIAVPGDLDDEVGRVRPDIEVVRGALVRVPDNRDFRISGIPLSEGYVFPCMAETLLMGLENMRTNGFCGAITASGVHQMCTLAEKHGFRLAG
jgi:predicted amino acid dehydrogenase